MISNLQILSAVESIQRSLRQADEDFGITVSGSSSEEPDYYIPFIRYAVENAFRQFLTLLDLLGLQRTYDELRATFERALTDLDKSEMGPEEPGLVWTSLIRSHLSAISAIYGSYSGIAVTKDLVSILRATNYFLGSSGPFGGPPANEAEVHSRIEAVLRCIFSDVHRKPRLLKPIKNFEPDTGIRSIETLIEYKFLDSQSAVNRVVDEILADTRGYHSPEWRMFFYVIYETRRFRPEVEWNQLLDESDVQNAQVIVLSGEKREGAKRQRGPREVPARRRGGASARTK
jgi:hypothetical protein